MIVSPNDPWSFGWDQLFAALNVVVLAIGVFVARDTVRKWRDEKAAARQFEIAERALRVMYEAQDVFREIRLEGHGSEPWKEIYAALQGREMFWADVQKCRIEIRACFGDELSKTFSEILVSKDELITLLVRLRIHTYRFSEAAKASNREEVEKHETELRKYENQLWGANAEDPIRTRLQAASSELERMLLPIVRRSIR
jgi:hypothetical protein